MGFATSYLERLNPAEYELTNHEAKVAKALAKIRIEEPKGSEELANYKYPTLSDYAEELARRNPVPKDQIETLLANIPLKVVRLYGTAMAMREHCGFLPTGSPNMADLIEHFEQYTVLTNGSEVQPYGRITTSSLRLVYSRQTSARLLIDTAATRNWQDFVKSLGEFLAAQRYRP